MANRTVCDSETRLRLSSRIEKVTKDEDQIDV